MRKLMKKFIQITFLFVMLFVLNTTVFALETVTDYDGHVHDAKGYTVTSGYFDWKDLVVNVNDSGTIKKLSVNAWYNFSDPGCIKGREYGVLFIEKGVDSSTDGTSFFDTHDSDYVKDTLFKGGVNVVKGDYPYDEYQWSEFTVTEEDSLKSLDTNKEYNVWLWTHTKDDETYYAFESTMGTMARVYVNCYVSKDGVNYKFDKKITTMGIIGADFNVNGISYPGATLDEAKTGSLAKVTKKDQEYNLYYTKNVYNIKLDINTTDVVKSNGKAYTGETISSIFYDEDQQIPTLKRTGYTFDGWTLNQDGTGTIYKNTVNGLSTENASTVTLYAKWTKNVNPSTLDNITMWLMICILSSGGITTLYVLNKKNI